MKTTRQLFWGFAFLFLFNTSTVAQTVWTLESCIDHAFKYNIQIKQSELGNQRAAINHEGSIGAFLPTINASASQDITRNLLTLYK